MPSAGLEDQVMASLLTDPTPYVCASHARAPGWQAAPHLHGRAGRTRGGRMLAVAKSGSAMHPDSTSGECLG